MTIYARQNIFLRKTVKFICVLLGLLTVVEMIRSKYGLEVDTYYLETEKLEGSVKIVLLTDLHNGRFGENNEILVEKIRQENPDFICMVGDMLNKQEKQRDVVLELIEQTVEIASVYFSYGNHEISYEKNFDICIREDLEKAGAVVLSNEYQKINVDEREILIGGILGYGLIEPTGDGSEYDFLKKFEQLDGFKLLLNHIPAGMLLWGGLEKWDIDLILSGHEHGGEIRIPWIGGLYSQDEGFWPEYTEGLFEQAGHSLILSRGLGTSSIVPRLNNVPELVCIEINGIGKGWDQCE